MRNTRKATAILLAMSLAISTALGNTAWGEIRPDTGNNRCVHVHTAECYKDADETATPSQIGKEPTECTHICSVESGCIRDTEKENNENADTLDAVASNTGKNDSKKEQAGEKAADRKDSSGNTDENKNLNDVPAQNGAALSASTPSSRFSSGSNHDHDRIFICETCVTVPPVVVVSFALDGVLAESAAPF